MIGCGRQPAAGDISTAVPIVSSYASARLDDDNDMDNALAQRIRGDNARLHDAPGYAEFYDDQQAFIRNPWEQRLFRDDLARIARRLPPAFRALDLGCGTGNLTLKLLDLGATVTSVDLSDGMLARLRRNLTLREARQDLRGPEHPPRRSAAPTLICRDIDEFLRSCPARFDLVCACSFLHHLPDYLATAAAAARRVAPGGCLYVAHEPLASDAADWVGRALEWIDFKWQRLEARTGLGGRVARKDPYYDPACLADYWAMQKGLDPKMLTQVLQREGLAPHIVRYDSKRHRILQACSDILGSQHLLRFEAWRPAAM
jgi:SAM-dependent methyltransferase